MSFNFAQLQTFYISGAGAVSGATTVTLKSFTAIDGTTLSMADFGSVGYGTLEPGNGSLEEQISFSGVTQNSNGTATLTGVKTVLTLTPYTETSGLAQTHAGSVPFVISNTAGFYNKFAVKDNNETINGQWTFTNTPIVPGAVSDASNTVKGVTKLSVAAAVASNPIAVGDNDVRVPTADPTTLFAPLSSIAPSGAIMAFAAAAAPSGWLLCDGSAISRTTYAALFSAIGVSYGSGDGSTTFNVPDARGRNLMGSGNGTKVATFASRASNVITVTGLTNQLNNEFQTGQVVTYHSSGSVMTGLTNDTNYYVVRVGNLTFSLASSLANAQNGTVISLSSDGSGTQTFTLAFTPRTVGSTGGEETHAMSSTELLSHTHSVDSWSNAGGSNHYPDVSKSTFTVQASMTDYNIATGGNAAMNNISPFFVASWIIKT